MDLDLLRNPPHGSTVRSFSGCWTCRLRRKKCAGKHPVCDICAALHITCHYGQDKPEWMDGGARQEEMAERLKREVKETAHRRRGERAVHISGGRDPVTEATTGELVVLPQELPKDVASPRCDLLAALQNVLSFRTELCPEESKLRLVADCTLGPNDNREIIALGRSDTILVTFYLEHLLPFLFPFYRPSLLEGGKAWILELMISSPIVRQATLCQSSYFFSLARGTPNHDVVWETVLTQTRDALVVLRHALQVINGSGIREHMHGAVRILASIIQVQRFELAVLSFNNWQTHLNAAVALFRQILDSTGIAEQAEPRTSFDAVMRLLGSSLFTLSAQGTQIPSADQAGFCFSSTLLILDDIIASTALQERPRLYEYHHSLLGGIDGNEPLINLEPVVGCQNWVLLQIGEIAVLDAWKQKCKKAGNLNVMELVHRATAIKNLLESHLTRLENSAVSIPKEGNSLLDILNTDYCQHSKTLASQSSLVTRVWAHAALIYLFVVVSGWQPASVDVRCHVGRLFELLTFQISPPALLRTMVWPFCVAGCLAEPAQETHLRGMVEALQPPSVFGNVRKALEIMENVWCNRDTEDVATRDLAMCFRSQGDLVLLV